MAEVTRYNLAQFVFDDTEITTDKFKTTLKIDDEKYTASNSHSPYAVSFREQSIEWECSDIDPIYRQLFKSIFLKQKTDPNNLPIVATYDFNEETGDLVEDDVFYDVYVTEISKENANYPFSVKGAALSLKQ